ncbi:MULTISPECIES: alpha/beta hydrolase [Chryseobacterium]|uniref:Alpha/beta superfamily hydrolase n=1 Tax=Chryseobacterium camelliae TaxID=1265445 RepID=A0ABU0TN14_9FLAO|nr:MULTISPECIES: alpha/beta hydrolase-fold protein [Chryseobacterium]MDT3407721.1 putative alpha/beta superfamily hydrolase [Pseudacidovorax intermedius]MDQ1098427.1 putative alpha/beta superfamily hydrolase [Chryseobacterium camelliae]MDQ1102351.1 putative alpha/beta superfamily hydrolase [Chryseobacterium sp. SORGH_AS_1048]MDR6085788.1 putative alpha/beta superfamily hydrolase [Chryseobacterium sp. SORGH_AS_0909]MDR6130151.1 putative alpha/beta superfamily hydrolase [Chryseobacterium sp. SOR
MKKAGILIITFLLSIQFLSAQNIPVGKVVTTYITAKSLQNKAGENPQRRVSVYLPPGYEQSEKRYPVIYFLHGFFWSDSLLVSSDKINHILDRAIHLKKIRPVIVVMPDESTVFKGSFYANSKSSGNWSDFTSVDLVNDIDKKYRTIPNKESRGISGHSMGGNGALRNAILHPEVFSSVYALSPGVLDARYFALTEMDSYKNAADIKEIKDLSKSQNARMNIIFAIARAYNGNPSKPPFFADLPFSFDGERLKVNAEAVEDLRKNSTSELLFTHYENLKMLTAIKLDWGRNDEFKHIPVTCRNFSQTLEILKIKHEAEEYIGTHGSEVSKENGRIENSMLPFFNDHLKFEQ